MKTNSCTELLFDDLDLIDHRSRIGGVAFEYAYRQRLAFGVGQ
jgi:hypothetical protein